MKLTAMMALTTVVVYLGQVQRGNGVFQGRIILAGTVLFIMLAALDSINHQLATAFAVLILVAALLSYGPSIFKAVS